jgi:Bacterial sugar transferase
LLRATGLHELPQLFSVLGGQMSLIGPRPYAVDPKGESSDPIAGSPAQHQLKPGKYEGGTHAAETWSRKTFWMSRTIAISSPSMLQKISCLSRTHACGTVPYTSTSASLSARTIVCNSGVIRGGRGVKARRKTDVLRHAPGRELPSKVFVRVAAMQDTKQVGANTVITVDAKRNDTTGLCDCSSHKRACGRRLNRLEISKIGLRSCLGLPDADHTRRSLSRIAVYGRSQGIGA